MRSFLPQKFDLFHQVRKYQHSYENCLPPRVGSSIPSFVEVIENMISTISKKISFQIWRYKSSPYLSGRSTSTCRTTSSSFPQLEQVADMLNPHLLIRYLVRLGS